MGACGLCRLKSTGVNECPHVSTLVNTCQQVSTNANVRLASPEDRESGVALSYFRGLTDALCFLSFTLTASTDSPLT